MTRKLLSWIDHNITKRLVIQFVEYLVSGGIYFWSGYILFALLWSEFGWSLWWAKLAANVFGWTLNYFLQRYWVFANKMLRGHHTQVTGRYILTTLGDFLLDYLIVAGLNLVGVTPYVGQFVSASFFTVWNYAWYRFWVFPERFVGKRAVIAPTHLLAHRAHGHSAYMEELVRGR